MSSDDLTFESLAAQYGVLDDRQDIVPPPRLARPTRRPPIAPESGAITELLRNTTTADSPHTRTTAAATSHLSRATASVPALAPISIPVPSLRDLRALRRETQQPSQMHAHQGTRVPVQAASGHQDGRFQALSPAMPQRAVQSSIHAYTQSSFSNSMDPSEEEDPVHGPVVNGIELVPVSRIPTQFRSLYTFGLFNAVQSSCWDRVSKDAQ